MSETTNESPISTPETTTVDSPETERPPAPPEPQWITGPSPTTVLAGLLALVVAVLAGIRLTTETSINWSLAAPITVIALGGIAVLLGLVSFSRRSRSAEHGSAE